MKRLLLFVLIIMGFCGRFASDAKRCPVAQVVVEPVEPLLVRPVQDDMQCRLWVDSVLDRLSLKERVGQLFIYTIAPHQDKSNRELLRKVIEDYKVGGLLFSGGLMQLMKTLPNPDLKWETTKSVNLGLDFSVLGGRLFGNYEFYVSKTSDLLYDVEIPHMNGMVTNSIPTNIGKLRNIGHEFSITGIPIVNKDFQWTITANFSLNKNKVESILGIDANKDGREDDLVASNIFIGEPLDPIYDYNIIGMWQVEDYNKGIIPDGFLYGTYKIEDVNHDNAYTAEDDRKILGYKDPLYRFSIQNNFTYKDFELNIFINSVQGGKNHYLGQPAGKLVIPDHLLSNSFMKFDYWTPENPDARYRQLGFYTNSLGSGFSPYISRSFVRLQELSLAYNLPKKFLSKIHVNRAKVFISASNLFTITGWDGWDPEAGQGISYDLDGGYPTMKSYTLGLNFEF